MEDSYNRLLAPRFFAYCYALRSRLVHGGDIRKAREEAAAAAAQLEVLVSAADRLPRLPLYPGLSSADQQRVIDAVVAFVSRRHS